MKDYILEVCTDSVESALAAEQGGATRLELCGNLVIGGTTPSPKLYEEIRKYSRIPMHVLIRPRFGDFCYTRYEYEIIRGEIEMFRELGAEGVVIGVLSEDGTLNRTAMEGLMEAAQGMSVTLHRAFDVCADPFAALEEAVSLGVNTILTSGQQNTCVKGVSLLAALEKQAGGRIRIQAGGGVSAEVIQKLYPLCGVSAWHMSGKVEEDSRMKYRKEGVNMGLPSLSEYTIYRTSMESIRKAKGVLEQL
ncbi:MAG: copper homeostasis protein CutC [Fusicatenibacter sp.]|nr:copper homeostasis protein CutC [Fusicatenibacter sp.]